MPEGSHLVSVEYFYDETGARWKYEVFANDDGDIVAMRYSPDEEYAG